jgi:hypothetical protein
MERLLNKRKGTRRDRSPGSRTRGRRPEVLAMGGRRVRSGCRVAEMGGWDGGHGRGLGEGTRRSKEGGGGGL